MIYGPLAPAVGGRWQMPIDIPLPAASKLPLHTWIHGAGPRSLTEEERTPCMLQVQYVVVQEQIDKVQRL